jgi:hypothetical protein
MSFGFSQNEKYINEGSGETEDDPNDSSQ